MQCVPKTILQWREGLPPHAQELIKVTVAPSPSSDSGPPDLRRLHGCSCLQTVGGLLRTAAKSYTRHSESCSHNCEAAASSAKPRSRPSEQAKG